MPAQHFGADRRDHVGKGESAGLLGHAGVEHDLEKKIAEFLLEIAEIATFDGVGDLVGFLDRVGDDGRKILLQIPRTAAAGRPQGRHDRKQIGNITGWFHGSSGGRANLRSAHHPIGRSRPVGVTQAEDGTSSA